MGITFNQKADGAGGAVTIPRKLGPDGMPATQTIGRFYAMNDGDVFRGKMTNDKDGVYFILSINKAEPISKNGKELPAWELRKSLRNDEEFNPKDLDAEVLGVYWAKQSKSPINGALLFDAEGDPVLFGSGRFNLDAETTVLSNLNPVRNPQNQQDPDLLLTIQPATKRKVERIVPAGNSLKRRFVTSAKPAPVSSAAAVVVAEDKSDGDAPQGESELEILRRQNKKLRDEADAAYERLAAQGAQDIPF